MELLPISKISDKRIKDYPVECEINQATMFPCLDAKCRCGKMIGYFQRTIESKIGNLLEEGMDISEARVKVFEELGIVSDCCLRTVTLYPFYTYNDSFGIDSMVDCTYIGSETNDAIRKTYRNKYSSDEKPEPGNIQKPFTNYGSKSYFGYYPLSFSDFYDEVRYEKKLYDIARGDKILHNDDEIPKLIFPKRALNTKINLLPTTIPIPYSEE